jgi:23S rRNA (guanosine2251-2'-O)-methyltransferase
MVRKRNSQSVDNAQYREKNSGDSGRLEGKNTILEALKANRPMNRIYLEAASKDPVISRIFATARKKGIVVTFIEKAKLDQMALTRNHQGVIADVAPHAYVDIRDILKKAKDLKQPPFVLILDGITDPNNLGSIIRTAECAGVHGIILPKRRSAGLTPVVAKVAAGAAEHMHIARVTNLTTTIKELKDAGLWVLGTDMTGETLYNHYDYKGPLAVVIGSEGDGISRLVRENCDLILRIPMYGKINSLNAAIACGLIVFEAATKREEAGYL